jgi:plastocyanin
MKKIITVLILISTIFYANAQVSVTVSSGNYYFYPGSLTINVGDTVHWTNDGGFHNVNFDVSAITGASYNNPESFVSTPTNDVDIYTHVFTIPGTYEYDCSVGSHAANGMVGTVFVNSTSSTLFSSIINNRIISKIFNIFGQEVNEKEKGFFIYKYDDGTIEKKYIIK